MSGAGSPATATMSASRPSRNEPSLSSSAARTSLSSLCGSGAVDIALDDAPGRRRFNLWLIGAFSIVAFALSALGVYGLIAFTLSRRAREMGIRIVRGAESGALVRLIVEGGLELTAIRSAAGLLQTLAITRVLDGLLFDVQASDPGVLVTVVLATVATAASRLTCRRVACSGWRPPSAFATTDEAVRYLRNIPASVVDLSPTSDTVRR